MTPQLDTLDHVHIEVPDKQQAAAWYREHLGFEIIPALRHWDVPGGPLTIGRGDMHLALFAASDYQPLHALAFRCPADAFLEWKEVLTEKGLLERCTDHGEAWSLYFRDPFGHRHEITCYDHEPVRHRLQA